MVAGFLVTRSAYGRAALALRAKLKKFKLQEKTGEPSFALHGLKPG